MLFRMRRSCSIQKFRSAEPNWPESIEIGLPNEADLLPLQQLQRPDLALLSRPGPERAAGESLKIGTLEKVVSNAKRG